MARFTRIKGDDQGAVYFFCPACQVDHTITTKGDNAWTWNNDIHMPTVTPSIIVQGTAPLSEEQVDRIIQGDKVDAVPSICHSWIRNGLIEYLSDSTHDFKNRIMSIPDEAGV